MCEVADDIGLRELRQLSGSFPQIRLGNEVADRLLRDIERGQGIALSPR
jgi:hypothetical protein